MKNPTPLPEVLLWLHEHHPDLLPGAVADRDWVWLTVPDLRAQPEVRASLVEFGFSFCHRGHPLPNGEIGTWAHSCEHPIRFKRNGKKSPKQSNELSVAEMAMLV